MADGAKEKMVKRFVGKGTRLGVQILLKPELAKYRPWLGQEVEVDVASARYGEGVGDVIVDITNPSTGTLKGVRIAVLTKRILKDEGPDFTIAEQQMLHEIAENRRTKTQPPSVAPTSSPA